jgi:hypothetical protein
MSPRDTGRNPYIGSRTARGWNYFIGRHPDMDDLNAPGSGQLTLNVGAIGRPPPVRSETPTGVPRDLRRGDRYSYIFDD